MELRLTPARAAEVLPFEHGPALALPLFLARTPAGFASPADDYIDKALDLNELCIRHPAATFFVRVEGDSMEGAGIREGDILVVDRALEPTDGKVVVAALDGELVVKRLSVREEGLYLVSDNEHYPARLVREPQDLVVWGVVTHVVHTLNG